MGRRRTAAAIFGFLVSASGAQAFSPLTASPAGQGFSIVRNGEDARSFTPDLRPQPPRMAPTREAERRMRRDMRLFHRQRF
jgi:hypothetical protein